MTVRNLERSDELCAFSFTSWRARLRPDARRTVRFLALEEVAIMVWCSGWVQSLRSYHGPARKAQPVEACERGRRAAPVEQRRSAVAASAAQKATDVASTQPGRV